MSAGESLRLWSLVFRDGEGYLCAFSGRRDPREKDLQQVGARFFAYPEETEKARDWLEEEARRGREAYACAHLLTEKRRIKENAAPVYALWGDLDGCKIPNGKLKPTVVVESSPGRYHAYWLLTNPISPELAEQLNKRLARGIGADASGFDLTQILRVPGTVNYKYPDTPIVKLLEVRDVAYDPDELDRLLPHLPEENGDRRRKSIESIAPSTSLSTAEVEKIIRIARRSKRDGEAFRKLHDRGDATGYKTRSEAHMALMGRCAYYFQQDVGTMVRVFKQTPLWENSGRDEAYLYRTARKAAENCTKTYDPNFKPEHETESVREALQRFALGLPWTGRGGPTDFAIFWTAINTEGARVGDESLIVAPGVERLSRATGGTRPSTVCDSIARLESQGLWRKLGKSNGRHADKFLIPLPAHTRYTGINLSPCVSLCITALCRIGNPAPQTEKRFDKNGRRIPRGASSHLKNPLGRLPALTVAKTLAYGGLSDTELAKSMGRRANTLRERCIEPAITAGLIVKDSLTNVAPPDLLARIERELEETGCIERERLRGDRFEIQRKRWDEERLLYLYGEPPEESNDAEILALRAQGERELRSAGAISELVKHLEPSETPAAATVITDAKDPDQLRGLAAVARERLNELRGEHLLASPPATERAARLLQRLRREDPACFAALSPDVRALAWEISGRGWTQTIFCGNTMRAALEVLQSEPALAGAVA